MPTVNEVKAFFVKRGFHVEVIIPPDSYVIIISNPKKAEHLWNQTGESNRTKVVFLEYKVDKPKWPLRIRATLRYKMRVLRRALSRR